MCIRDRCVLSSILFAIENGFFFFIFNNFFLFRWFIKQKKIKPEAVIFHSHALQTSSSHGIVQAKQEKTTMYKWVESMIKLPSLLKPEWELQRRRSERMSFMFFRYNDIRVCVTHTLCVCVLCSRFLVAIRIAWLTVEHWLHSIMCTAAYASISDRIWQ